MDHNNHDLHANDREVGQGIHPDGDIAGIDSPTDIKCRMIVRIKNRDLETRYHIYYLHILQ